MTMIKATNSIALGFLFLSFVSCDAVHLRSKQPTRDLRLRDISDITTSVLNGLLQNFGRKLEGIAESALEENFDPVSAGNGTTVGLGSHEFPLPSGTCKTSASVTYGLGNITGLSNFENYTLELVPGTEKVETMGRFGLKGAAWNGTWILNATFANLTADASAFVEADSCFGDPIEQSLTGTATFNEASIHINMTLGGESSNLLFFVRSSEINQATVEGLDFELGSVDAGFGSDGTFTPNFEFSKSFDAFLLNEFSDKLAPRIIDALNQALADALPIDP